MNVTTPMLDVPARHDPIETAAAWLETTGTVALARVVSTWGSSPVPVGGQLVVASDGRFEGSVSGGCVEVEVIAEAGAVIAEERPRLLEFGVDNESAWRAGLPCGGKIKVLVQPLLPSDQRYLKEILAAQRSRRSLSDLTNLKTGQRSAVEANAAQDGDLGALISEGESKIVVIDDEAWFLHVRVPPVRLVIVGATHITQALSDLANRIGYDVVIVDPRPAFASSGRFGSATVLEEWPETACQACGLDNRTAVVALTHAAHLDDEALTAALRADCLYVGALGSKKTHAKRLNRLLAAGVEDSALARIHGPVGLDIGAKGPDEIAISILAEIISVSRRGRP